MMYRYLVLSWNALAVLYVKLIPLRDISLGLVTDKSKIIQKPMVTTHLALHWVDSRRSYQTSALSAPWHTVCIILSMLANTCHCHNPDHLH